MKKEQTKKGLSEKEREDIIYKRTLFDMTAYALVIVIVIGVAVTYMIGVSPEFVEFIEKF